MIIKHILDGKYLDLHIEILNRLNDMDEITSSEKTVITIACIISNMYNEYDIWCKILDILIYHDLINNEQYTHKNKILNTYIKKITTNDFYTPLTLINIIKTKYQSLHTQTIEHMATYIEQKYNKCMIDIHVQ